MIGDTIFALSSGAAPSGIAVIRISGPAAAAALITIAGSLPERRRATLRWLRDPADGTALDQALLLWLPGPGSATGEDLAELHLHGGRSVVAAVLAVLGKLTGMRPALAGEFTRRAFENGRIDLTEAEGLADLLAAETDAQRRNALSLAGGELSRTVERWRASLLEIAARIEAILNFSDEDDVPDEDGAISGALAHLASEMEGWLARPVAERLRDGVRVVLAGPPNVGKSTLLNALTGRDAAIVSAIAGTTRDLIEAPVAIEGTAFLLIDTAGLRGQAGEIEQIGIDRAKAAMERADIILWLGDAADCPRDDRIIIVHPRADLAGRASSPPQARVAVSAVTGQGMSDLTDLILATARSMLPRTGEVALHRRHRDAIAQCVDVLHLATGSTDLLLLAEGSRMALRSLDTLTGRAGVEDMLDALFGSFCIGK